MVLTVLLNAMTIGVLSYYLANLYNQTKKTELLIYYYWMHFFAILVIAGNFLAFVTPEGHTQYTTAFISCILSLCFSLAFFFFCHFYTVRKHVAAKWLIATILSFIAGILLVLLLVHNNVDISRRVAMVALLLKTYLAIGLMIQFTGSLFLIHYLVKRRKRAVFQLFIMVISFIAFTLQFVLTLYAEESWIIINPILVLSIFSLIYLGSIKFGMFDTLSEGVRKSLELYNQAIFVLYKLGKVVYSNSPYSSFNPDVMEKLIEKSRNKVKAYKSHLELRQAEMETDGKILTLTMRPLKTIFNQVTGYVCIVHDDTELKSTIQTLKAKNEELQEMNESIKKLQEQTKKLAILEQRNHLAKEIHDVLGHSLNLALHTLESNRLIVRSSPDKAVLRLHQVLTDIDRGLEEISVTAEPGIDKRNPYLSLAGLLKEMSRRLQEVHVKLEILNIETIHDLPNEISKTVYRLCQEACTNAIKHGKATEITLSFKTKEKQLEIHFVDNGVGCACFIKGNGLRNMEERVERLNGSIHFSSFEDTGFLIRISIPLKI